MTKEELIKILNASLTTFSIEDSIKIITEYLIEKGIEVNRIQLFINTICSDPMYVLNNSLVQCLQHSIKYYCAKLGINTVLQNNKIILYL